jgi:hypothetical protein
LDQYTVAVAIATVAVAKVAKHAIVAVIRLSASALGPHGHQLQARKLQVLVRGHSSHLVAAKLATPCAMQALVAVQSQSQSHVLEHGFLVTLYRTRRRRKKSLLHPQPMKIGTHHPQPTKMDFLPLLYKTGQLTP